LGFEFLSHQKTSRLTRLVLFWQSVSSALDRGKAEQVPDIHGLVDKRLLTAAWLASIAIQMCLIAIKNFLFSMTFAWHGLLKNDCAFMKK